MTNISLNQDTLELIVPKRGFFVYKVPTPNTEFVFARTSRGKILLFSRWRHYPYKGTNISTRLEYILYDNNGIDISTQLVTRNVKRLIDTYFSDYFMEQLL